MPVASATLPRDWALHDLLEHLGGIDARRVRLFPPPGSATEKDVIRIEATENRLFEVIDGVLVEKVMGFRESFLAGLLIQFLGAFVKERKLGFVTAPDGAIRLAPRQVRIPDVSYFSWDQVPGRRIPNEPIPDLAPLLAVEVLSEGNTPGEMRRKLRDYFMADIRLVWFIDPRKREARVFTAPDVFTVLKKTDTLDGGDVLSGFKLPLSELFADLAEEEENDRPQKRRKKR